jgi:hypothetical protein
VPFVLRRLHQEQKRTDHLSRAIESLSKRPQETYSDNRSVPFALVLRGQHLVIEMLNTLHGALSNMIGKRIKAWSSCASSPVKV